MNELLIPCSTKQPALQFRARFSLSSCVHATRLGASPARIMHIRGIIGTHKRTERVVPQEPIFGPVSAAVTSVQG